MVKENGKISPNEQKGIKHGREITKWFLIVPDTTYFLYIVSWNLSKTVAVIISTLKQK